MNKQILGIILGIFLISFASAVSIIAGNNYTFSVDTTNTLFYDVVGNSSNLGGLTITQDIFESYSNITISPDILYKPDSFTLIFFEEKIIEKGGRTKKVYVENKTVEYVEKEKIVEIEKEIPSEPEIIEKIPKFLWFLIILLGLISIILFLKIKFGRKHEKEKS